MKTRNNSNRGIVLVSTVGLAAFHAPTWSWLFLACVYVADSWAEWYLSRRQKKQ